LADSKVSSTCWEALPIMIKRNSAACFTDLD
jgi:hypothetical protein